MAMFAGVDWGSVTHAICVINERGERVLDFAVEHDASGLTTLISRLRKVSPTESSLRIAIERPSGLLVDRLMDAGFTVVPIHPNVVKASRPRYRAVGGKCDRGDAYLLADLLRTDGHRFRVLAAECDEIRALRALVRTRADLMAERIALTNQLRALLDSFWPGAAKIFPEIDSPIAMAFIKRYPTPVSAAHLGEKRLGGFLAAHGYSGHTSAAILLDRLQGAAGGQVGDAEARAKGVLVSMLTCVLSTLVAQLADLKARIEREVAALPDGQILMSFPRAAQLNAAQILSELGSVRERFQSEAQLASEAGVCPVTYQSGKSRGVVFRWACNHRLRVAITLWADNSRRVCQWANAIYQRARARGARHPHAVRILARAWIRVLWRAWQEHSHYDPVKHHGVQQLLAAH
jgi:transposase